MEELANFGKSPSLNGTNSPLSQKREEHYTYEQPSRNDWTSRYAGMRVYNSSSSAGAPVFTNLAWYYNSAYITNEFGQVQQGYPAETTNPSQIGEAIAQLLDDGFRIINISVQSQEWGYGPTTYVLVKPLVPEEGFEPPTKGL